MSGLKFRAYVIFIIDDKFYVTRFNIPTSPTVSFVLKLLP